MMAHFTITGEYLTEIARDMMLSDEPGQAYRLLAQGLSGEGLDEVARKVLTGELDLIGDSTCGVDVAPAEDVDQYIEDLRYVYAGRVKLRGLWYRPKMIITSFGDADARAAGPMPTKLSCQIAFNAWSRRRADFYAEDGECVEDVQVGGRGFSVVFEPCGESPHWLKPAANAQQAVDEWHEVGRSLIETGAHSGFSPSSEARSLAREHELDEDEEDELLELAHAAEDEFFAEQCKRIAEQVREQAGDDVFDLELPDGRTIQVPRTPFTRWALSKLPEFDRSSLPPWETVSPSGMKLQCDNPDHTDWLLGAGLSWSDAYDENLNRPVWDAVEAIQVAEVDRG